MTCGMTPRPPLAKGTYAAVNSKGVTSEVPSEIDGVAVNGDVMPRRWAVSATRAAPTSWVSSTETVLRDSARAVVRLTGPRYCLPEFSGDQPAIEIGWSMRTVSGRSPLSSAVRYTNGLNAEPGWRWASTARLNWLRA